MKKYKCVIFDCDGVLVDTESTCNQSFVEVLKPFDINMSFEEAIQKFSGSSLAHCVRSIEENFEITLPDDFEDTFRAHMNNKFIQDGVPAIPGIHELLEKLSIPYCVASSGPQSKIAITLGSAKLLDKFEGRIFSCYDIDNWKPEPGIFIHAAKKMGFVPTECVVIEDSLPGVQAALAGGFDVFAYDQHNKEEHQHSLATQCFTHMKQLHDLLIS
jgi:HAD superfamily hydrolase (TIGR01509 family)